MRNLFQRWRARRKAARELYAMSPRDLADIGLNRGDIRRVVSEI